MSAPPSHLSELDQEAPARAQKRLLVASSVAAALVAAGALDLLGLRVLDLWPTGLLIGLNLLVVFTSWRWVLALGPSDDWIQLVLDVAVVALSVIMFTILVLGSLGHLTLGAVVVAIGLESLATVYIMRRRAPMVARWIAGRPVARPWLWGLFAGLLLFELAQVFYANWLLPPSGDALGYHLPFAAEWIQSHRFSMPMPASGSPNPPFYPLNSSIWMAWLMLPMPGDVVVRFVQAPFLVLLLLAAVRLSRSLGIQGYASWIAAIVVVSLPDVTRSIAIAGNDLILAALLFVAVSSLVELWSRPTLWRLILGALALGLACGTKESALPFVAVLGLAYCVAIAKGWQRRGWLRVLLLWVVTGVVAISAGGYSYVRNLAVMANPFYPVTYQLGGKVIFAGLYATTTEWKQNHPYYPFDWPALFTDSRTEFGYVIPFLVVPGVLLATAIALRRRRVGPLLLLAWILSSFGIFWYILPVHEARFLYAPVGWAVILGVWGWQAVSARWRQLLVLPAAVLVAISAASVPKYSDAWASVPYWLAGVGAVLVVWAGVLAWSRLDPGVGKRLVTWGEVAALMLTLCVLPIFANLYNAHRFDQWTRVTGASDEQPRAWQQIATASQGEPVVVDMAGTNVAYTLYGPDLRNRVVRVSPDGSVAGYDWGRPSGRTGAPNPLLWLEALDRQGVDYLYVTPDVVTGVWPVEAQWAADQPALFRPVLTGEQVRIWKLAG